MPNAFDASNPPFDRLTPAEVAALRAAVDIQYFRPGDTIVASGAIAEALYVVIKGAAEERSSEAIEALLGPGDSFDSRALVQGNNPRAFVAREETLCYVVPRDFVLSLIQKNPRFGAFFYLDISRKLDAVARDEDASRFSPLMRARVRELFIHPASFIDAGDSIETAGHRMREINSNALFVRDGERVGIITGMNLSKAVVLTRMPIDAPVGAVTHYDVVSLGPDDFVYSALILMTKHNKRRIAVRDGGAFIGVLEDIDVLSFLAGNSQLVAERIERAVGMSELAVAAAGIGEQVRMLRRQGLKVEVIAEIVSDLNRRVLARLFEIVAPAALRDKACLVVMGSEGRGEQTVRTDQDNGLILAEPVDEAVLNEFRTAFSEALRAFGFPPCPGNVMVGNRLWSRPLAEYVADFRKWVALPDPAAHLNVAIFYDADSVAGQRALLVQAKAALIDAVRGESAYLAHFARAVDAFPTPIGFFNNIITAEGDGDAVDLKKGGLFPIVHGVRSLALELGLMETRTDQRIARLGELGVLKSDFGRQLTEAFRFLMALRLDTQLSAAPGNSSSLMKPGALSTMERDLLRDALHVVKQFREIVRHRFKLGMF
jgi:CBS domain-containing protein